MSREAIVLNLREKKMLAVVSKDGKAVVAIELSSVPELVP